MAPGCHRSIERSTVTLTAHLRIVLGRLFAVPDIVRVMTSSAKQRAAALFKTSRLPQPVSCAGDLESVVAVFGRSPVEVEHKIRQRLTGLI
jgi:hypothetical protein